MVSLTVLFCGIIAVRIAMSFFVVRTADVPDEWWQSTEVAYKYAFGKGELTWEWREAIRSFIYPMPFYLLFVTLKALALDTPTMIWATPRIMTAFVAAGIDWFTFKLAGQSFGPRVARVALMLSMLNWFTSFVTVRTQSNVAEALALVVAATYRHDLPRFLFFAGLGVALRVTFVLPAAPLFLSAIGLARSSRRSWFYIVTWSVVLISAWVALIAVVDRYFYGFWVCTPYEFLHFNVFKGLSALFGTHPVHWYVSQGLPVMLLTMTIPLVMLPFVSAADIGELSQAFSPKLTALPKGTDSSPFSKAAAAANSPSAIRTRVALFYFVCAVTIAGYSLLPHKEFRFVYPIVPLLLILAAVALVRHPLLARRLRSMLIFLGVTNVAMLIIFGGFFQRGTIDVMTHLRNQAQPTASVDVLMGCHSTPGYSHVHRRVEHLRTTNCTVIMDQQTNTRLPTEHHLFIEHPVAFADWAYDAKTAQNDTIAKALRSVIAKGGSWPVPDAIIIFAKDAEKLSSFLQRHQFYLEKRFYHTFFVLEPHMDTHIDLWRRGGTGSSEPRQKSTETIDDGL